MVNFLLCLEIYVQEKGPFGIFLDNELLAKVVRSMCVDENDSEIIIKNACSLSKLCQ